MAAGALILKMVNKADHPPARFVVFVDRLWEPKDLILSRNKQRSIEPFTMV